MAGAILIIVALVVVIPVGFLMTMTLVAGLLGWWAWQWQHAPSASGAPGAVPSAAAPSTVGAWLTALKKHDDDDGDDD